MCCSGSAPHVLALLSSPTSPRPSSPTSPLLIPNTRTVTSAIWACEGVRRVPLRVSTASKRPLHVSTASPPQPLTLTLRHLVEGNTKSLGPCGNLWRHTLPHTLDHSVSFACYPATATSTHPLFLTAAMSLFPALSFPHCLSLTAALSLNYYIFIYIHAYIYIEIYTHICIFIHIICN
jgi:hypothetical protein